MISRVHHNYGEISRLSRSRYMKYRLADNGVAVDDITQQRFTHNVSNYFVDSNDRSLAMDIYIFLFACIQITFEYRRLCRFMLHVCSIEQFLLGRVFRAINRRELKSRNVKMSLCRLADIQRFIITRRRVLNLKRRVHEYFGCQKDIIFCFVFFFFIFLRLHSKSISRFHG